MLMLIIILMLMLRLSYDSLSGHCSLLLHILQITGHTAFRPKTRQNLSGDSSVMSCSTGRHSVTAHMCVCVCGCVPACVFQLGVSAHQQ